MYYTVYQITNLINGKIYIGSHKTSNLEDEYMGSGKILLMAIEKYGIENFKKKILEIFDNSDDMFSREFNLVNKKFILREDTYNIKLGGCGGFDYVNSDSFENPTHSKEHMKMMSDRSVYVHKFNPEIRKKNTERWISMVKERHRKGLIRYDTFAGKNHLQEAKDKIGKANSKHQQGKGYSQYGTCWIHNNRINKKIDKEELYIYLDEGWIKGRKMKF